MSFACGVLCPTSPLPTDEERDADKEKRVEEVLLKFPTKDKLIEEYMRLMHSGKTCGISSGEWALMDVAKRLKVDGPRR